MDEISVKDFEQGVSRFLKELSPKEVRKAVRSSEQRVGNRIRKRVLDSLRSKELKSNKAMEKGVRLVKFSKKFGFKVTIKPDLRRNKSMYRNRQGKLKPVLAWAETGTDERKTRKGGRNRGKMPGYGFMPSEDSQVSFVQGEMWPEIEKSVTKTAQKNGLL